MGIIWALAICTPVFAADDARGDDTPRGVGERLRGLDVPERAMEAVESGSEAAADAADRVGRGIERAREAAQRQLDQFQIVHLRRLAQLERVRELADEQGRADALERVERLIEREMERYGSQLARVQERLGLVPEDDDADEE